MKRILLALALALGASALAHGEQNVSCGTGGSGAPLVGKGTTGNCTEILTNGRRSITATIQSQTASTSQVVLWATYCPDCEPVRFPAVGEDPIINIGSVPGKKARTFRFPADTYKIYGEILAITPGDEVAVLVNYE